MDIIKSDGCSIVSFMIIHSLGSYSPGRISQKEKLQQGRGKGKWRSAAILLSVGHLKLITTLNIVTNIT